jgi:ribonuclease BN (tRNA processing enzyme)
MQRSARLAVCDVALLVAFDVQQYLAQRGDAPATPSARVITLGTVAVPPPRPYRAQSLNLLIVNSTLYVVDAGDGAARRIAKAGFNLRDVGPIFVTHHHDDHTAGVGTHMSTAWDSQRTAPIHVYGPPRTEELIKAAVRSFSINAEPLRRPP